MLRKIHANLVDTVGYPTQTSCLLQTSLKPSESFLFNYTFFYKAQDPVVEKLYESTEEGQKVSRNSGVKLVAVFRRIQDSYGQ